MAYKSRYGFSTPLRAGYVTKTYRVSPPPASAQAPQQQAAIAQIQAAQEKANLLNEQRYQQLLGTFESLGKAGRTRIEEQATQQQGRATQGLVSRGLGSTTITSAVQRGIASDAERLRQQLEETLSVAKAGIIERRSDVGPDLGMFANLLQAAQGFSR